MVFVDGFISRRSGLVLGFSCSILIFFCQCIHTSEGVASGSCDFVLVTSVLYF